MKILLFYLLYPFSFLYKTVTSIRNHLYDIGHFRSFSFQIKTISVGNLTVGGTGKTPHIEYIINLLKADRNICTLSRGYGRKTTGIVFGDNNSTATSIGDEPMQYLLKYSPQTSVVVGEERALAIPTIIHELPKTDLILLDDAFQHRPVKPGLNILLCDFNKPFYSDHLMPTGRLRESRSGAKRADVVLVSKCPDSLSDNEMRVIKSKILPYIQKDVDIFFTGVTYKEPVPIFRQHKISNHAIAISGIANPALF
ncbi:MAG TPA: tetraacyldisaccharide 4'-kinase, partial [Cytophagaceae bacterium]